MAPKVGISACMLDRVHGRWVGVYLEGFHGKIFSGRCSWIGTYSLGTLFFWHLQIWQQLWKCTQVYAYFMIGTGMCLGMGCTDLGWKIFHDRCSGMGVYSLGIVWDFVFFASADLMRASKVYTSACILHDRYWHVSGDRLHWFGVKIFSWQMFGYGCLLPRDSVHIHTTRHTDTHMHAYTCTCTHTYPQPYRLSKLKVNCLQVPVPIICFSNWLATYI